MLGTLILVYVLILVSLIMVFALIRYVKTKKAANILELKVEKYEERLKKYNEEHDMKVTEYSNELIKYIRVFTVQVSTVEFYKWEGERDITKGTRESIKNLIEKASNAAFAAINRANINYSDTLFTEEYVLNMIFDTARINITELLNKATNEYSE